MRHDHKARDAGAGVVEPQRAVTEKSSELTENLIGGLEDVAAAFQDPHFVAELVERRREKLDVRAIRNALRMTQPEFAARFGISISTLRNWEQGTREPEGPARAYLTVIKNDPAAVLRALDKERFAGNDVAERVRGEETADRR